MRGALYSLLGALAGAAIWVALSFTPVVFLAGVAAAAVGAGAGYGMRLGARTPRRPLAAILSAPGVAAGRYGAFLCHTAKIKMSDGGWTKPIAWDAATARFFLTHHLLPATAWDLAISLLFFALAAYVAWRTSWNS